MFLYDALRGPTWQHVGWTALLGLLAMVILTTVSHAVGVFLAKSWQGRLEILANEVIIFQMAAFTFLACVLVADQAVRRGAARVRAYVLALVVASVLFAAVDTLIRYYYTDFFQSAQPWWKPVHTVSTFMWAVVLGGFATFVYADLKRNRESAARLQAARLRRTQAARDVLQTRLQAMQARVEPQFLFDTLDRIGEIYERDAARGQPTIDDLIVLPPFLEYCRLRPRSAGLAAEVASGQSLPPLLLVDLALPGLFLTRPYDASLASLDRGHARR